jgi:hypothetical protein
MPRRVQLTHKRLRVETIRRTNVLQKLSGNQQEISYNRQGYCVLANLMPERYLFRYSPAILILRTQGWQNM